jgi:hypothetical protein
LTKYAQTLYLYRNTAINKYFSTQSLNLPKNRIFLGTVLGSTDRRRQEQAELEGRLGWITLTFLANGTICRERIRAAYGEKLRIRTRQRQFVGVHHWAPWTEREHMRVMRKKLEHAQFAPPIGFKMLKIELHKSTTLQEVANELKVMFSGSDRLLLSLRCELGDDVTTWASHELLESEEYGQLVKTREALARAKNNGGQGVRFYQKMELLYQIDIASKLNVATEAVDEVLSSVKNELKFFD